jgi:hypothetical protein
MADKPPSKSSLTLAAAAGLALGAGVATLLFRRHILHDRHLGGAGTPRAGPGKPAAAGGPGGAGSGAGSGAAKADSTSPTHGLNKASGCGSTPLPGDPGGRGESREWGGGRGKGFAAPVRATDGQRAAWVFCFLPSTFPHLIPTIKASSRVPLARVPPSIPARPPPRAPSPLHPHLPLLICRGLHSALDQAREDPKGHGARGVSGRPCCTQFKKTSAAFLGQWPPVLLARSEPRGAVGEPLRMPPNAVHHWYLDGVRCSSVVAGGAGRVLWGRGGSRAAGLNNRPPSVLGPMAPSPFPQV